MGCERRVPDPETGCRVAHPSGVSGVIRLDSIMCVQNRGIPKVVALRLVSFEQPQKLGTRKKTQPQ